MRSPRCGGARPERSNFDVFMSLCSMLKEEKMKKRQQMKRQLMAWILIGGVLAGTLAYGRLVIFPPEEEPPVVPEGCICVRPNTPRDPMVPLPKSSLNEAIPPRTIIPQKPCCER